MPIQQLSVTEIVTVKHQLLEVAANAKEIATSSSDSLKN